MTMCCLVSVSLASCSDWREIESVNIDVKRPCDQAPELWSRYTAALRSYKQTEHYILYARLENSPSPQAGEKNYMRCLPDSLDIVSLTNADNFSAKDSEDLAVMSEKGIKVLYRLISHPELESCPMPRNSEPTSTRSSLPLKSSGLTDSPSPEQPELMTPKRPNSRG